MSEYMEQYERMAIKANEMTEEERRKHVQAPRDLTIKLHDTPYFHRSPYVTTFESFAHFQSFMADKGYDRPGIVWMKEGEKYHDVCVDKQTGAVQQQANDRHHEYSNAVKRSDDWALAEAIARITPAKVEMA